MVIVSKIRISARISEKKLGLSETPIESTGFSQRVA